jgi:hypothetical protein
MLMLVRISRGGTMKVVVVILVVASLGVPATRLTAQPAVDSGGIVAAAIHAVAAGYPGRVVVALAADTVVNAIIQQAELERPVAPQAEVLVCTSSTPPSCTLRDADVMISVGALHVRRGQAEVSIGVAGRSSGGPGQLWRQLWSVRLERGEAGWRVVAKEVTLSAQAVTASLRADAPRL